MTDGKRTVSFWVITIFLILTAVFLLLGQTMAVFDYDLAVRMGLQEDSSEITAIGVAINRAYGVADTVVYIPLIIASIAGLVMKKRWSLIPTAAVMGISAYWTATSMSAFTYLEGVEAYSFVPGAEYWMIMSIYLVFGVWGILYLIFRGDRLA